MKLFLWNAPYHVPYGSSMVFAIAENVEDARAIATSKRASWWAFGAIADGEPREWLDALKGEPTRIVELPCAEWHKWCE